MTSFRKASLSPTLLIPILTLGATAMMAASGCIVFAADDLGKVIDKLDASAKSFTSAQAAIDWDNVQTKPIFDKDVQLGTVVFARAKDGQMEVAVHIRTENGRPVEKDLCYAGGVGKMYDAKEKQIQVFQVGNKSGQLETFLTLGFGGSGQDLKKNWDIAYAGTEQVDGVAAAKLQLIPHDPSLARTAPKVLLWIDMDRGVALKQQRFDASGNYLAFTYSNIKLNSKLPSNAFEIKTASGTQVVNH
jgi:outer membrane lipoprotein-sorting protein